MPADGRPESGRLPKTLAYYGAFIALGLVLASVGPTLPGLAALTGSSLRALSWIFVARSSGYLAGALFGGRLFDRFAGHPLLAGMLSVMALSMALVPLCSAVLALSLVFFVLGLAEGALDAGGNTLLTWLYPRGLAPWMNALHAFFGVGAFLSPLVIAACLGADGSIGGAYWMLAALVVPAILFVGLQSSPPIQRRHEEDEGGDGADRSGLAEYRLIIFLVAGLLFAAVGAEVGFLNWVYTYAQQQPLDADAGTVLTSTFLGAFTIGRLLGIPLAARFRPESILLTAYAVCGVAGAIPLWQPASMAALTASMVIGGVAVAPMFATILALAGSRMPISGRATGWFFVGSSTGGMSVPWVIGQLFEAIGPESVFYVILADVGIGLVIYALFRRLTAGDRLPMSPVRSR